MFKSELMSHIDQKSNTFITLTQIRKEICMVQIKEKQSNIIW